MNARLLVTALIVSAMASVAGASTPILPNGSQAGWFRYVSDHGYPYYGYCDLHIAPDVDTLTVEVEAIPFQKARFTVPDPPFGSVVGETWFFSHTGDRLSGLELDIGGCTTAGIVTLGEIYVSVNYEEVSPSICAAWDVGTGEIQNCSGRWLPTGFIPQNAGGPTAYGCMCFCWQCCYSLQPYDLYPPDGATSVPLDVVLTWAGYPDIRNCQLWITTDPTCATVQILNVPCEGFDPGLLTPNTTYFWRPTWSLDPGWGCGGAAAIHSFKTVGDVSAQQSTWGRAKSLYRE